MSELISFELQMISFTTVVSAENFFRENFVEDHPIELQNLRISVDIYDFFSRQIINQVIYQNFKKISKE